MILKKANEQINISKHYKTHFLFTKPIKRAPKMSLGGGGEDFLVMGYWKFDDACGRIFTTGLTTMGSLFQEFSKELLESGVDLCATEREEDS